MLMVTQPGGSAYSYGFNTLDIQVAAKTGSAQVSSATESNAVFVCFCPLRGPGDRSGYRGGKGRLRLHAE